MSRREFEDGAPELASLGFRLLNDPQKRKAAEALTGRRYPLDMSYLSCTWVMYW